MIDEVFEELERKQAANKRGNFKEQIMQETSISELKNKRKQAKLTLDQKKEVLKEVLSVMKFTVSPNDIVGERDKAPYVGKIYFFDETKKEARLLLDSIPLLKVKSADHIGFENLA